MHLNCKCHTNDISVKLNKPNALLSKTRKYVNVEFLRSVEKN